MSSPSGTAICIVPTFNERANIGALIDEMRDLYPDLHMLVVDDNSPDGTADVVKGNAQFGKTLHLLQREKKQGLGRAYVAGFRWCLDHGYITMVQMDADLSHRPVDLARLLDQSRSSTVVVGSRWVHGGKIKNWSWIRYLISFAGNFYARIVLGKKIKDWTGGFNVWHQDILKKYNFEGLESHGYAFQIEMKYIALRLKFSVIEVPIVFEERRHGQSKMSLGIILEAFRRVWGFKQKYS